MRKLNFFMVSALIADSLKEVIQPHVLVGLPCYDLTPVIGFTLGGRFLCRLA